MNITGIISDITMLIADDFESKIKINVCCSVTIPIKLLLILYFILFRSIYDVNKQYILSIF